MDKDIFEQLYRQHYAAALLYAQGLCCSRPLAEDMVQEAFCRAWLALPDGVVSFRSWLFRVLRNLIIDHLRRQKHLSDANLDPNYGEKIEALRAVLRKHLARDFNL